MNLSIFWARVLGLYTLILTLWCFTNINHLNQLFLDLSNNPLTLMDFGIFTVLLGLAVVVSHSLFKGWPVLVTLVGYLILIKGIILLFFPHWVDHLVMFWQDKNILLAPLPASLIGLALVYCGFIHFHRSK